jgi:mycothiol synthase
MGEDAKPKRKQLQMLWPERRLDAPPEVRLDAGLALRTYRPGDDEGFVDVMEMAGFARWSLEHFRASLHRILPEGLFFAVDGETGRIVATAQALHNASDQHPFGGELGWVAGDPAYRGRGLGMAVCAAATRRFLANGYRRIYLRTDDFRLAALKTYLKLGYEPFLFAPDMTERWRTVCQELAWPFTPGEWPGGAGRQEDPL